MFSELFCAIAVGDGKVLPVNVRSIHELGRCSLRNSTSCSGTNHPRQS